MQLCCSCLFKQFFLEFLEIRKFPILLTSRPTIEGGVNNIGFLGKDEMESPCLQRPRAI
jgi:hypothetical protein